MVNAFFRFSVAYFKWPSANCITPKLLRAIESLTLISKALRKYYLALEVLFIFK